MSTAKAPWTCPVCVSPKAPLSPTCKDPFCEAVPALVQDNDSQPSTPGAEFHDYDDPNYPSEEDGEEVSEAQDAEDGATIHEVYEEAARRREKWEKREKRGEGGEETEVGDDEEAGGADDNKNQGKSSTADHTALINFSFITIKGKILRTNTCISIVGYRCSACKTIARVQK
jgi:hypothetical protein